MQIDKVISYKYLGVIIPRSGKLKYCIEDRIAIKAARAIHIVQGALSTTGNVSVKMVTSIFDTQVLPILRSRKKQNKNPLSGPYFYVQNVRKK